MSNSFNRLRSPCGELDLWGCTLSDRAVSSRFGYVRGGLIAGATYDLGDDRGEVVCQVKIHEGIARLDDEVVFPNSSLPDWLQAELEKPLTLLRRSPK